jgi:predicted transcriptional regulator of viral defense system
MILMTMPTTTTTTTTTESPVPGVLTITDAAKVLGITAGALRKRLERGRKQGRFRTVRIGGLCVIPADTMIQLFAQQQEME